MKAYLTEKDMLKLAHLRVGLQIKGVRREMVKGRPRMVLYFENCALGLPLTRHFKEQLTEVLGPHPELEAFFSGGEDLQ